MKNIYFLILTTCILSINLSGQKEDFVWFSGSTHFGGGATTFYTFDLSGHSKESIVLESPRMIRDNSGKATMADENGNLLFYTDGFDVYNRLHEIMLNGDSTFQFEGRLTGHYEVPGGLNLPDWSIIVPSPGNPGVLLPIFGFKARSNKPRMIIRLY
jgi:hypothetical protein